MIILNEMEHSGWIDLVLARAHELREAGVLEITMADGCAARLDQLPLPPAPPPPPSSSAIDDEEPVEPLHDRATYGGVLPGFEIEPLTEEY